MKGSYDNHVSFFLLKKGEQQYKIFNYDEIDGMMVSKFFPMSVDNNCIYSLIVLTKDEIKKSSKKDFLKEFDLKYMDRDDIVLKNVEGDRNLTIEYDIAKNIINNYENMTLQQKKYSLAFLERYLFSFDDVKEFQENGILDFSKVDEVFGNTNYVRIKTN